MVIWRLRSRLWSGVAAVTGLGGLLLFLFPERTGELFAWTVPRGDSAAVLGAGLLGVSLLALLVREATAWRSAGAAYAGLSAHVAAMAVATVLHLGDLNFGAGEPLAQAAALCWTLLYLAGAVLAGMLVLHQLRWSPDEDPAEGTPVAGGLRLALLTLGVALAVVGFALFVFPDSSRSLWAWDLSDLSARALASVLLGLGIALAGTARDNVTEWLEPVCAASWWLAVLSAMAVTRFQGSVDAGSAQGALLWLVLVGLVAAGVTGELAARRVRAALAGPPEAKGPPDGAGPPDR